MPELNSYQVEGVDIVGATITGVLWDNDGFLSIINIERDGVKYELAAEPGEDDAAIALLKLTDQEEN
jgi:hypothetical protein